MRHATALLGLLLSAWPAQPRSPVRVLILTGQSDLPYHDWRITTPVLQHMLAGADRFSVRVVEDPARLTARDLRGADVVVVHYNGPRWGAEAERGIEQFVRSGKGLVAVHGVSYGSFFGMERRENRWVESGAAWPAYADMLGVTWAPANIGHARRHVFTVKIVDPRHPITRGMGASFMADDELYHRMTYKPNVHVLAAAFDDPGQGGSGKDEPILWTVAYGRGRVFHMTLGHDTRAMSQPGFIAAFTRGTEWAGTGKVRLAAKGR